MARPKFYRDPVHVQIRYERVRLDEGPPSRASSDELTSWLVRKLIDCKEFQRLRHIRQNGLTNLVFHGAEHSRFSHSMGVAHLAGEMFDRVVRNMGEQDAGEMRTSCVVAALLHDVGHGPFSHTLEEILEHADTRFDHEEMTRRFLEEETSDIAKVLHQIGADFPAQIACYIDKQRREKEGRKDHWAYRLVSSQLDADRLDYLLRDAMCAGLRGGGFDLPRLLDSLKHLDGKRIAVDRGAMETVESYLVTLDHMYRVVYYHHAVRAASALLSATLRRGFDCYRQGDRSVFPGGKAHPLAVLMKKGQTIPLAEYARLGEFQIWSLVESWQSSKDQALADLATRLMRRRLWKTIDVDPRQYNKVGQLEQLAQELTEKRLPHVDRETVKLYVTVDEPSRTSYRLYDWRSEKPDEAIWMVDGGEGAAPIEKDGRSKLVAGLKETSYFHRLVFPEEIRDDLLKEMRERGWSK